MTLHFFNDVANDAESTQKSKITSKCEIEEKQSLTMGNLINRIPGLRLYVESSASLALSTSVFKALPGKLDIKRHSPSILYLL